jgi:hypothetical protein
MRSGEMPWGWCCLAVVGSMSASWSILVYDAGCLR